MMDALSAALFKTTGDEKFKVEEKPKVEDMRDVGARRREKYEPTLKYAVQQLGEKWSHAADDDCMP
jgi:hypothetical protein